MAIAPTPKKASAPDARQNERAAEAFINAAGQPSTAVAPATRKTVLQVRFDPAVLQRVDQAARHRGISRSAWIQYVVSRALDQGEG